MDKEKLSNESNTDNDIKYEQESNSDISKEMTNDSEESIKSKIKNLKEKLKKTTEEKQSYLDGWQRDKAEFVNARKRDKESLESSIKYANENLIDGLLPVLESFDMAMGKKESWEKVDKNWRLGVEYIYNQLKKVLEENGLKEIDPTGLEFDPMRDEAISYEKVEDKSMSGKIINVVQKGYELNGKAVRAPKVRVGE